MPRLVPKLMLHLLDKVFAANGNGFRPACLAHACVLAQRLFDPPKNAPGVRKQVAASGAEIVGARPEESVLL